MSDYWEKREREREMVNDRKKASKVLFSRRMIGLGRKVESVPSSFHTIDFLILNNNNGVVITCFIPIYELIQP